MGNQLTYADRDYLLQHFDSLRADWKGNDEQLLADAYNWAKSLVPDCGFEYSLARDIAVLSRYLLSHKADEDIAGIARGGLLYTLNATKYNTEKLGKFGLLDEAFISSYAVHEIRMRLGEYSSYNPPRLTQDEQKRAENLFLELAEKPLLNDVDLTRESRNVISELNSLVECGLFRRFQRNVEFLISIIENTKRSNEEINYARGALSYLICEEDTIPDGLGIVGYLDDNFIAQMAVDLIEPARAPWLDILDATIAAWPFLNNLIIDDGGGRRPISEYLIINSALSCRQLRSDKIDVSALILPNTGPLPFFIGFIASLGLVQASGQREVTEKSFSIGQKVLVDNSAIAIFTGFREFDGHKRFGLTQYHRQKGYKMGTTHYWPITELRRLVPADFIRSTRGELIFDLDESNRMMPALEYLFNAGKTAHIEAVTKRLLVVSPIAYAYELARHISLYGFPLKDVVPMGHLSGGELKSWSSRFGRQEPILIFISDLDMASAYAENNTDSIELAIIENDGRNAKKSASLGEMSHLGVPVLAVTPERFAKEFIAGHERTSVWEWISEDYTELLWPQQSSSKSGYLSKFEHKIKTQSSGKIHVKTIEYPLVHDLYKSVRVLRSTIAQREEEHIDILDEIETLSFNIMSRLLRLATPLSEDLPSYKKIESDIEKLSSFKLQSIFISEKEKYAINEVDKIFRQLFAELKLSNTKANLLQEFVNLHSNSTIICPDSRIFQDLEYFYKGIGISLLSNYDYDAPDIEHAIIPGWYGNDRMARLLVPPSAQQLFLVFYGIENAWYNMFFKNITKNKKARSIQNPRSKIFPTLAGWSKADIALHIDENDESDGNDFDSIQEHIRSIYQQHAYRSAKSDGIEVEVPARLVLFEGDAYAFLRDSFRANVVTHLLDNIPDDSERENVDIKLRDLNELRVGDALLFHRRSDRDVIRLTADKELPPNAREITSLWRKALINHVRLNNLTYKELWAQLKNEGCPLHVQTIRNWLDDDEIIGPRQYERDIKIIAKVTKDGQLTDQLSTVLAMIYNVFGAHQRASNALAKQVLERAVNILREENRQFKLFEIEHDIVLVRIAEIDGSYTQVRMSIVNRLQEPD